MTKDNIFNNMLTFFSGNIGTILFITFIVIQIAMIVAIFKIYTIVHRLNTIIQVGETQYDALAKISADNAKQVISLEQINKNMHILVSKNNSNV